MPYPCCGPHCSVCRMSMSSVPCSSSIRFLYWSFSFINVDTLLAVEVDCLLPRHGGASIQSRAYSNSDEIGIRSDIPVEAVRCVVCRPTRSARLLRASRKDLLFAQIPHSANESSGVERSNRTRTLNLRRVYSLCRLRAEDESSG